MSFHKSVTLAYQSGYIIAQRISDLQPSHQVAQTAVPSHEEAEESFVPERILPILSIS